jgi:hypothetical protein
MSTASYYAYCGVIQDADAGLVRVTEYLADDEDDLIGLHGDAVTFGSALIEDDALRDWIRSQAQEWDAGLARRASDLTIEIVRGQNADSA